MNATMNQWQNGGQADGLFGQQQTPGNLNNSMFSNSAQFDFNSSSPFPQNGMPNGNQTPAFNQSFQPGQVVPQKRPHDAGMSGSPPPQTQGNSTSRAQTPNFSAFTNPQAGQQFPTGANPYSHLQQPGSSHATPSPTMQNQPFRQPSRMANASPNQFPQNQNNFNQMTSASQQNMTPTSMASQMNMGQFNNMNQGMGFQNMAQMGGASNMSQQEQSRQYQLQLMQQQAALRQQAAMRQQNGSMPRSSGANNPGQNTGMPNGQAANLAQAQQMKRSQFLQQCAVYAAKAGRQLNPSPSINGRPLDLYSLFQVVISAGGSGQVERGGHWQAVANKLGFSQLQFPTAAEDVKTNFINSVAQYEKAWMAAKVSQKQEQARIHAQQMAGFGAPNQSSPTKNMQSGQQFPAFQQNQQSQSQPQAQPQALQQSQPNMPFQQPSNTPVQANASLPVNGMSTPQPGMGAPGTLQHRRNSSLRKQDAMTPQGAPRTSPYAVAKPRDTGFRPEPMKHTEQRNSTYEPARLSHAMIHSGGINVDLLAKDGADIIHSMPLVPDIEELGVIDFRALALSMASGISHEVRYALDIVASISARHYIDVMKCEDLLDALMDRADEQLDILKECTEMKSDIMVLPTYQSLFRQAKIESVTLQEVNAMGTPGYRHERAIERVLGIIRILRNLSCDWERNGPALGQHPAVSKWFTSILRFTGTRKQFFRTAMNSQEFYKDAITFLSNIAPCLELSSRNEALIILRFLLVFTPEPLPKYSVGEKLTFGSFNPIIHKYTLPAVDSLAKLLARQDPNRAIYKSIFQSSNHHSNEEEKEEDPLELLTKTFALAISILPDRSKRPGSGELLETVEQRKPYIAQGMLAADILSTLVPSGEHDLARSWLESEDGWPAALLNMSSILSCEHGHRPRTHNRPPMPWDIHAFRAISVRGLSMMKRLTEKAGQGTDTQVVKSDGKVNGYHDDMTDGESENEGVALPSSRKWGGMPQSHAIIGALTMQADVHRESLNLLCNLHDMAANAEVIV